LCDPPPANEEILPEVGQGSYFFNRIGQKRPLTSSLLLMELAHILKPDQSRSRAPAPALFSQPLLAPGRKAKCYDPCPRGAGKNFKKCHSA
ncbi:hypothetical protein N0390_32580, partial [Pseudomonas aeruginosa]|nr:hypothetical protein [Pseudomonas aeruginosa]